MNDRTYDYYLIKGNEVIDLGRLDRETHFAFMHLKLGNLKKILNKRFPDYHLKVQTPFEYEDVAQIKIDGRKFEEQFKNHKEEK